MQVLAIDPGNTFTAYVVWDCNAKAILAHDKIINAEMRKLIRKIAAGEIYSCQQCVIENIESSYGSVAGITLFDTSRNTGRLQEIWESVRGKEVQLVNRKTVASAISGHKANDSKVRQALINRLGAPGTKTKPGATYGIVNDQWQALAVAIWFDEKQNRVAA